MFGLAFLPNIGTTELIILLVLGLLIFGRRLPEVGRSLGKGIVEFKKGVRGIDDEVEQAEQRAKANRAATSLPASDAGVSPRLEQPAVQGQDVRVSRSDTVG